MIAKFINMIQPGLLAVKTYHFICPVTGYLFCALIPEFNLSMYIHIIYTILDIIEYA